MKKLFAIILLTISFATLSTGIITANASSNYQLDSFVTPYGETIEIGYLLDSTAKLDYPDISSFPDAVKINDGDNRFNCYTYAIFYEGHIEYLSVATSAEIFAVNKIGNFLTSNNPCCTFVSFSSAQKGDVVLYKTVPSGSINDGNFSYSYIHSGIIDEKATNIEDTTIISKWGEYAVYKHKIGDDPYAKGLISLQFIEKPITAALRYEFVRFNHNYTYKAITSTTKAKPITKTSKCHKATCADCGISHYEIHDFEKQGNNLVCSDCGYISPIAVSSINNELEQ